MQGGYSINLLMTLCSLRNCTPLHFGWHQDLLGLGDVGVE